MCNLASMELFFVRISLDSNNPMWQHNWFHNVEYIQKNNHNPHLNVFECLNKRKEKKNKN